MKKIGLVLMSIFLMYQSYTLLKNLEHFNAQKIGFAFLEAWLISVFITGIFAFLGFGFPTHKLISSSYYQIKNPNRLKKLYSLLKVEWFRKFLLATFWKSKKQRTSYFDGKRSGINHFIDQSQKAEFGHLMPFIVLMLLSIYFVCTVFYLFGIFILWWNCIGNLYPIILQRHHRMRIEKMIHRLNRRP